MTTRGGYSGRKGRASVVPRRLAAYRGLAADWMDRDASADEMMTMLNRMNDIVADLDRADVAASMFDCIPYRCRISRAACVSRQAKKHASLNGAKRKPGEVEIQLEHCTDECYQGEANRVKLGVTSLGGYVSYRKTLGRFGEEAPSCMAAGCVNVVTRKAKRATKFLAKGEWVRFCSQRCNQKDIAQSKRASHNSVTPPHKAPGGLTRSVKRKLLQQPPCAETRGDPPDEAHVLDNSDKLKGPGAQAVATELPLDKLKIVGDPTVVPLGDRTKILLSLLEGAGPEDIDVGMLPAWFVRECRRY
jgi:hypothetical protein